MSPVIDYSLDPLTGDKIPPTDPRASILQIYYRLLNQFQSGLVKTQTYYLEYTWHDWAVNYLLSGGKNGIPVPQPPSVPQVKLLPNYTIQTSTIPVCTLPAIPSPSKYTVQIDSQTNQYKIVPITPAGAGSGGQIVGSGTGAITQSQVISYLKSLSPADLNDLMAQVFAA